MLGVPAELVGVAELVAADLVGVGADGFGCADDCEVTGALRGAGVVRFGVCANDVIDNASTNKVSGSTKESRDNRLKKRFIRGSLFDAPRRF